MWAKLFCGFSGRELADGAADVILEDENPDDAAMEKTGIAVTPLVVVVVVVVVLQLLP